MALKKIIIGKYKRKGKKVSGHSKKIFISKKKRSVFTSLAKEPFETGGVLDFERDGLENAKVHFGSRRGVSFPHEKDYEVTFHTHPPKHSVIPSLDDLVSMRDDKEKHQLIFNKKIAVSLDESRKFQSISNSKLSKMNVDIERDINKGMTDKQFITKYKSLFKKQLGLNLVWHGPGKQINLKGRVV